MKAEDFAGAVRLTAERYEMDLDRPLALVSGGPDSVALLRMVRTCRSAPATRGTGSRRRLLTGWDSGPSPPATRPTTSRRPCCLTWRAARVCGGSRASLRYVGGW